MFGYSSPEPFRITLDAKFPARAFLEDASKADSLQMNPHYDDNWISRRFEPLLAWWRRASGGMPLWLGAVFLIFVVVWCWLFVEVIEELWHLTDGSSADEADGGAEREHIQAMVFAIGLLGALLTAPIVPYRLWLQNRQTTTAEQQREIAEQGLITDRLTKAIEQLGAEKSVKRRVERPIKSINLSNKKHFDVIEQTEPNLEVRLGAIYSLERIAQDSERDHIPVMETLCAYIRQNAPASEAEDHGLGEWPEWIEKSTKEQRAQRDALIEERTQKLFQWIRSLDVPRVDIQAALIVIGRRGPERIAHERRQKRNPDDDFGFRLDLRDSNLRRADLSHLDFSHALLTDARMEGADLIGARMEGADLDGARMEEADLTGARMEGAILRGARMEGALLDAGAPTGKSPED